MPFALEPLTLLTFLALGAVAGVLAGLLGIGGGLVLVAALAWLLPAQGAVPTASAMHAALATSLASIVFTAMSSAKAHARRGSVLWPTVAWMVPGLLLGGWLGSRVAVDVDGRWLRWGVAAYCLIAAAQMLLSKPKQAGDPARSPRGVGMSVAGTGIGAVSAFVGIGGGSMTVPLLTWLDVPPVRAVGTSSACGVFIGLASA
ncbi:sulfite exporter TauE/SafE family protein, partial [Lysobacter pythonis]